MPKKIARLFRKRLSRKNVLRIHKARAIWANLKYGFPSRQLLVFGVTGTKGKTTTCHFLASILREAGYTVGMATTVEFHIGEEIITNNSNKSVLPPNKLQELLQRMKKAHCNAIVLEVTSHALDQYRVWGIPFRYVGLTNITHDHLDYHKTWDDYQAAKLKLFKWKKLKAVAVNANDQSAELFLETAKAPRRWVYNALAEEPFFTRATDHLFATKVSTYSGGSSFTLTTETEKTRVQLGVPGRFNIENALCAAALCLNLNLKIGTIAAGLENMTRVPGRLEKIETKKGFTVMVDYAHTPDSLEKLYATLRPDVRGRMMAVLGSCGDRDRTKRPIMGALAARFCDYVFITDEEPYTEDPLVIMEEVAKGVPRGRPLFKPMAKTVRQERPIFKRGDDDGEGDWWWKIADRREAIRKAIEMAKMDDLILVTGMGSQNFKIVGQSQVPWNDRQVIEEILREKNLL